jgi:hypothetical protein
MKRLLIFALLFPALATIAFFAVIYALTGAEVDSVSRPALLYLIFIGPALLVALTDWGLARTAMPAVLTTTLLIYGVSVLAIGWLIGVSPQIAALGLIAGIPTAVCSWLSNRRAVATS